ncbi:hypothetical protein D9M71_573600 [compost metagenome]
MASGSIIPSSRTDASIDKYLGEPKVAAGIILDGSSWEVGMVVRLLSNAFLTSLMFPPLPGPPEPVACLQSLRFSARNRSIHLIGVSLGR